MGFGLRVAALALALSASVRADTAPPGAEELPPVAKDQKGLLILATEMPPAPPATQEEMTLGIKPYPGVIRKRLAWLYVPEKYDPAAPVPAPLLLALHPRARLSAFSSSIQLVRPQFLDKWCKGTLDLWKDLADEKGFLLLVPLGDPDPLTMGLSWHTGDRSEVFSALVSQVARTHTFDPKRVYAAGTGDGAHALISSSIAKPDLFAAVAACNPPLLEGSARRETEEGILLLPQTVDGWVQAGGLKTPLCVLAGEKGKREFLSGRAPREFAPPRPDGGDTPEAPPPKSGKPRRFVDHESVLLADHMERMAAKLKTGEIQVLFSKFEGIHRDAFPASKTHEIWDWVSRFPPPPPGPEK